MRKWENYWRQDPRWYYFDGLIPVIRDEAPEEVKASFERYKQQKREHYAEEDTKEAEAITGRE